MSSIRPMLAAQKLDLTKIIYPCFIQPKIDGIRARAEDGRPISRSGKVIPNQFIQDWFGKCGRALHGLDGELVVVNPLSDELVSFNDIQSGVMSESGAPNFRYIVFDIWNDPVAGYPERLENVKARVRTYETTASTMFGADRVQIITPTEFVSTEADLLAKKDELVALGHEGAIIRFPESPYKYGRSTMRHGGLIKFKDFIDDEARVTGFEELQHNDNPQQADAFGLSKRSSHKANQRLGGVLGKLVVNHPRFGEFRIGSGFDWNLRETVWNDKDRFLNMYVSFKYQPHGMKDKPRSPIFKGFRHPNDMGA